MPTALSIHIGLNQIDPNYYGTDGKLAGCINDANDMKRIADSFGYRSSLLIDSQATKGAVVGAIGRAAQELVAGDILLLTYSGHGSHVADVDGDEPDGQDETWCLYDQMLIDDELRQIWSQFRAGVRIFMLSDSCHSGTVARMMVMRQLAQVEPKTQSFMTREVAPEPTFRLLPPQMRELVQQQHRDQLGTAQWVAGGGRAPIGATIILISGCQDNQLSLDGSRNGLFTQTLKTVWNNGAFTGNYRAFHQAILNLMPPTQTPNYDVVGASNAAFEAEKPFTVGTAVIGGPVAPPAAPASPRPVIQPLTAAVRGGPPPRFSINPGAGKAYALQFSTEARFLYAIEGRIWKSNYYSTLAKRPLDSAPSYPIEVELPRDVWEGLCARGERLYYRLWRSDSRDAMRNQLSSAPSQATAPSLLIEGARVTEETFEPVPPTRQTRARVKV